MVIDAIHRMVANDIGALAVTDKVHGDVIGVVSERDYLNKVVFFRLICAAFVVQLSGGDYLRRPRPSQNIVTREH